MRHWTAHHLPPPNTGVTCLFHCCGAHGGGRLTFGWTGWTPSRSVRLPSFYSFPAPGVPHPIPGARTTPFNGVPLYGGGIAGVRAERHRSLPPQQRSVPSDSAHYLRRPFPAVASTTRCRARTLPRGVRAATHARLRALRTAPRCAQHASYQPCFVPPPPAAGLRSGSVPLNNSILQFRWVVYSAALERYRRLPQANVIYHTYPLPHTRTHDFHHTTATTLIMAFATLVRTAHFPGRRRCCVPALLRGGVRGCVRDMPLRFRLPFSRLPHTPTYGGDSPTWCAVCAFQA